jgi:hypothetical protein
MIGLSEEDHKDLSSTTSKDITVQLRDGNVPQNILQPEIHYGLLQSFLHSTRNVNRMPPFKVTQRIDVPGARCNCRRPQCLHDVGNRIPNDKA